MKVESRLRKTVELCDNSSFKRSESNATVKLACMIYKGGNLLASAVNQKKTNPTMKKYNSHVPYRKWGYLHAEMAALLQLPWEPGKNDLKGCTLYVARKRCDGSVGMARPCAACAAAIKDAGIKKIVYTTSDGYAVEHLS